MRWRGVLGVMGGWLLCASALAAPQLVIQLADDSLRSLLEKHLEVMRWRGDDRVSEAQWQRLLQQTPQHIHDLLASEGYFSSVVRLDDTSHPPRFIVELGPQTTIGEVQFQLEGEIAQRDDYAARRRQMRLAMGLERGLPFTSALWAEAKKKGLQQLLIDRYPAATLAFSQAEVDPETAQAKLVLRYDSGVPYRLGEISIEGLQRYPDTVIRHLAPFQTGDDYRQDSLLDFQTALQSTPYFARVFVDSDISLAQAQQIPVRVAVEEGPQQRFALGAGYSSNTGYRSEINYRHHNLFGSGWMAEAGLKWEQKQQQLELGVRLPVDEKGYRHRFAFVEERQDLENLPLQRDKISLSRSRQRQQIDTTLALQYQRERAEPIAAPVRRTQVLWANYVWSQRQLTPALNPQRGYAWQFELGGAVRGALSDTSMVRGYARGVRYLPLPERRWGYLLLRAEAGQVWAEQGADVPTDLLFRTGGSQTVRGYDFESLGVRQGQSVLGGRVMMAASAEYVYPMTPQWGSAVFIDVGDATSHWPALNLKRGYGVGARWASPVGPLAFDVAYGEATQRWRLHFALNMGW